MKTLRNALEKKLRVLDARYSDMMRGRMIPSPKAMRVKAQADALRNDIAAIDREAANRLALSKAPIDEVLEVIAIPLLADVMNDLVAGVDNMLRRPQGMARVA